MTNNHSYFKFLGTIKKLIQQGSLNNELSPKIREYVTEQKLYDKTELLEFEKILGDDLHKNELNYFNNKIGIQGTLPVDYLPNEMKIISEIILTKIRKDSSIDIVGNIKNNKLKDVIGEDLKKFLLGEQRFSSKELEEMKVDFKKKIEEYFLNFYNEVIKGGTNMEIKLDVMEYVDEEVSRVIERGLEGRQSNKVSEEMLTIIKKGKLDDLLTPDLKR